MQVDEDTGPTAGAAEPAVSGSESGLEQPQQQQGRRARGPDGVYKSPGSSSSEEEGDGTGAVVSAVA